MGLPEICRRQRIQTFFLYAVFPLIAMSAEFLDWAPKIRFYNGVPYIVLAWVALELTRLAYIQYPLSVAGLYLSLVPYTYFHVASREIHIIVAAFYYCATNVVYMQSHNPMLKAHVIRFTLLWCLVYLGGLIFMMLFYTDTTGVAALRGGALSPPIHWGQEGTLLVGVLLTGVLFRLLVRYIDAYGMQLLEKMRQIYQLQEVNDRLIEDLQAAQGIQNSKLDLDSPMANVIRQLRDLIKVERSPDMRSKLVLIQSMLSSNELFMPTYQASGALDSEQKAYMDSMLHTQTAVSTKPSERSSTNLLKIPEEREAALPNLVDSSHRSSVSWDDAAMPNEKQHRSRPPRSPSGAQAEGRERKRDGSKERGPGTLSRKSTLDPKDGPIKSASIHSMPSANVNMEDVGKQMDRWDFDVFALGQTTRGKPLYYGALALMQKYGFARKFQIKDSVLKAFFLRLEDGYMAENPYHNSIHAADVLQTIHFLISHTRFRKNLPDLDIFGALVAAAMHDFKHPGFNNNFQINTSSPTAMLYNDVAVLENFHCAEVFEMITADDNLNILAHFHGKQYMEIRKVILEMVLATDMARHFDIIGKFTTKIAAETGLNVEVREDRTLLMMVLMKCADISNSAKPFSLSSKWVQMITAEFFRQGRKESELGLPVSPFMDEATSNVPQVQTYFIGYFVQPLYQALEKHPLAGETMREQMACIAENLDFWQKKEAAAKAGTDGMTSALTP